MKKPLIVLLAILIAGCSNNEVIPEEEAKESFEGTITYKVNCLANSGNEEYDAYQKQKFGPKAVVVTAANGNIKRTFPESGVNGVDFFIYIAKDNRSYQKMRNIDTVYSSDCSINPLKFIEEKEGDRQPVLGINCKSYSVLGVDEVGLQKISLTYYYPEGKEYIDPSLYANYKEFFLDKIMEKTKAPYYKLVMDMQRYTMIFEADKVTPEKVKPEVFDLPNNVPVKKFK